MARFSSFWKKKSGGEHNWIFQYYRWWTFSSSEPNLSWEILNSFVQNRWRMQNRGGMWVEWAVVYFKSYCRGDVSGQTWADIWHFTFSFGFSVLLWSSWEFSVILNKYVKIFEILGTYEWTCFADFVDSSLGNLIRWIFIETFARNFQTFLWQDDFCLLLSSGQVNCFICV